MPSVPNIQSIRAWLRSCSELSASNAFRVNYVDDDPEAYAIFTDPSPIRFAHDITGKVYPDSVQELNYYFVVSLPYGKDINENIANVEKLNAVIAWLYTQNAAQNFPTLTDGTVISLMPTMSPFPTAQQADAALYKISLKMRYRRN